jgi:hypothetical protein
VRRGTTAGRRYGTCTVALPEHATGNSLIAAEHVVYAAREAYRRSGQKIAMTAEVRAPGVLDLIPFAEVACYFHGFA